MILFKGSAAPKTARSRSLRSWRDFARESFCFGSEAVNESGEAVRGLVKSPGFAAREIPRGLYGGSAAARSPAHESRQLRRLRVHAMHERKHSRPQSPRSFWPVAGIESSGALSIRPQIPEIPGWGANGTVIFFGCTSRGWPKIPENRNSRKIPFHSTIPARA